MESAALEAVDITVDALLCRVVEQHDIIQTTKNGKNENQGNKKKEISRFQNPNIEDNSTQKELEEAQNEIFSLKMKIDDLKQENKVLQEVVYDFQNS